MSFSLFPSRKDDPPPVPPKTDPPIHHSTNSPGEHPVNKDRPQHNKTIAALHKIIIPGSPAEVRSLSATGIRRMYSSSPVQLQNSPRKQETEVVEDFTGRSSSPSPQFISWPSSRPANAKQKAKDVWISRRKDSTPEIETTKIPVVSSPCLDSPTVPGLYPVNYETLDDSNKCLEPSGHLPRARASLREPKSVPTITRSSVYTPPPAFSEENWTPLTVSSVERTFGFRTRADSEQSKIVGIRPTPQPRKQPVDGHLLNQFEIEKTEDKGVLRHKEKQNNLSASLSRHRSIAQHQPWTLETNNHFPKTELTSLQRKAMRQCEKFNILSLDEVESFSHELLQLDSRCEYLRQTRESLRQGRRTLHNRLILYLRTTRPGAFSQDNLLKQEEALGDLDSAIEDWETKLEKAERRRMEIKQMLLEHVAAALSIVNDAAKPKKELMATPPSTPERQKRQRHEQESTTVYAHRSDVKQEN